MPTARTAYDRNADIRLADRELDDAIADGDLFFAATDMELLDEEVAELDREERIARQPAERTNGLRRRMAA